LIVRVLRGVVPPDQVQAFHEQASAALARAREGEGLLFGEVGRQALPDCSEQVVFVTIWQDLAALYRWIGVDDLLATPLHGDGVRLAEMEVQHYETLGEPAESGAAEVSRPRS
jgi:heme-degrading monooxygenase HmoA